MNELINKLDWNKMNGLIPAIVQDINTQKVLMLGYMNQAALQQTLSTKIVTFYSRSRNTLWVKGETSGNYLQFCEIVNDCDNDSLLLMVKPLGPTCHQGTNSCYGEGNNISTVIEQLEKIIMQRQKQMPTESYTAKLFSLGLERIAQKVGEEGVEVALAGVLSEGNKLCEEVADLLFHVLVLLRAREIPFSEVLAVLVARNLRKTAQQRAINS
ncbi:bifunctional phosphoribosyl-AMP cyclohydrolase/phosphoribosyl-ATP diphosphatase HisIE [Candidatus Berkiella aquae]|uniref:Histidine biosynthesis bifunctional protein HisIE n=1 Tax=Candidatus Berkiella aquae TaxID=295108 RepID=A0A0Q9YPP3_9GAMM|nr:bifunctional phosphoribosyl-AMP cyclohydrolase/phosphoribosyl-ATP diphosphatase HisIE [Candidatus Berkiella aquae]MCS5710411.1 bifunctional phosphoribosyl-AMP cyclohydrolase/phosphoribosyl-ATP diphosphatase HisIE [Candidatus Berkiella aquae]